MNQNDKFPFYYSIFRIGLAMIVFIGFLCLSYLFISNAFLLNESKIYLYVGYAGIIFFGYIFIMGLFSVYRIMAKIPYIIITNEQVIIQPQTRKEIIIAREDYVNFHLSNPTQMNNLIIYVGNADKYEHMFNKTNRFRLFHNSDTNVSSFALSLAPLSNKDRTILYNALQFMIHFRNVENEPIVPLIEEQLEDVKVPSLYRRLFLPEIPVEKTINKKYFIQAYGLSLFFFMINFTIFYYFTSESFRYLLLIIISLFTYPLAQAFTDWLYGFKIKQLDKYGGPFASTLDQLRFISNAFVIFHVSIYIAPISGLFFSIRYFINKRKN